MSKKRIISALFLIPLLVSAFIIGEFLLSVQPYVDEFSTSAPSFAATKTWDGGGDGLNWESGANWNPDGVPDDTDDVVIDANVTVEINGVPGAINSLTLGNASGTTAPILLFDYDAHGNANNLDIDDGILMVHSNATITHRVGTTGIGGRIDIDVQTGNAFVNGTITANALGYAPGEGPGAGTDTAGGCGGASYGGVGGTGRDDKTGAPGEVYGSMSQPSHLGSGGGICFLGNTGYGGGSIRLTVADELALEGTITANGFLGGTQSGGGSGGSIWLDVDSLTGAGTIQANGGAGHLNGHAGGGGGGRVAVYYNALSFSTNNIRAYGGAEDLAFGGAGTVYLKNNSITHPFLIIDNDNRNPVDDRFIGRTKLTPTSTPLSLTLNTLEIRDHGYLDLTEDTEIIYTTLTWTTNGNIADNGGDLALIDTSAAVTIPSGSRLYANTAKSWSSLTVSGTVSHSNNNSTAAGKEFELDITTTGNITVNNGGTITANHKGYSEGHGPGAGAINATGAGGGSYGGVGGTGAYNSSGTPGEIYGSMSAPVDPGSGGGLQVAGVVPTGSSGGGVIRLSTASGTVTVNGSITANGEDSGAVNNGAGSGGSIYIVADTVAGSGTIVARGGIPGNATSHPGGGGGGRIAIYYDTLTLSDNNIYANGNRATGRTESAGGAGTVYLKDNAETLPTLIIDNRDLDYNPIVGERWIGRTRLTPDSVPLTLALDELIVRNEGNLDVTADTTITYNTLAWSDDGIITDNGGSIPLTATSASVTIPQSARLYQNVAKTWTSLVVNGVLTHSNNHTDAFGEQYKLDITTTGDITISSTGSINAQGRGYDTHAGPGKGVTHSGGGGGGSYGGRGGSGAAGAAGEVYGSITAPVNIGSGGGWVSPFVQVTSPRGGGAIHLTTPGTVTINGPVSSSFLNSSSYGGASGGSVYIDAGTVTGSSTITANGGDGAWSVSGPVGSGGGGRIAVYYDTLSISTENIRAFGGRHVSDPERMGGAGTVFLKDNAETNGDLIIDNNDYYMSVHDDRYIGRTKLTPASTPLSLTVDELIIRDKGNLDLTADTTITYSTLTWTDGVITDNGGTAGAGITSGAVTIPSGAVLFANTARTYSSLTINGTLSHTGNTTAETNKINLTTTGNVTVNMGAAINVIGQGYRTHAGPGAGEDEGLYGSGAGHGGTGGITTDSGSGSGSTYGSATDPENIGSGGGFGITINFPGGYGGGAVKLSIGGDMTLTGSINANAQAVAPGQRGGGGSGGSIWLDIVGDMYGSGAMTANGGSAEQANAGAGAGGRIRYECSNGYYVGTVTVNPGAVGGAAGAGTISEACTLSNDPVFVSIRIGTTSSGSNVSPLSLTAGASTTYYINGVVQDADGYTDISDVDARLYRSGVTGGTACTADNNDCYIQTTCALTGGSGTTVNYSCQVDIAYYADPTDTGTYSAETWNVRMSATDGSGTIHDDTYTNEISTLLAVSIPGNVTYGALSLGQKSDGIALTATNVGNVNADIDVSMASPMTCDSGTIPIGNNRYDVNDVAFDSMANTLSATPTTLDVALPQQTNDSVPVTDNIYWGIEVPATEILGNCTGTLVLTAT